jgi:hypothetical protein
VSARLADDLARVLEGEPFGLTCRELRRRVGRRLADVLAALEEDSRFEHSGRSRGSRWRIAAERPHSASWVRMGTEDSAGFYLDPSGVPVVGRMA